MSTEQQRFLPNIPPQTNWLKDHCMKAYSSYESLQEPVSLTIFDQQWLAVSNAHYLIIVRSEEPGTSKNPIEARRLISNVLSNYDEAREVNIPFSLLQEWIGEPEVKPPCETCESTGYVKCDNCHSFGSIDCKCDNCNNSHPKECKECSGEGKKQCANCRHAIPPITRYGYLGPAWMNLDQLYAIFQHLISDEVLISVLPISPQPSSGYLVLMRDSFDQWRVVIMSLVQTGEHNPAYPTLDITKGTINAGINL